MRGTPSNTRQWQNKSNIRINVGKKIVAIASKVQGIATKNLKTWNSWHVIFLRMADTQYVVCDSSDEARQSSLAFSLCIYTFMFRGLRRTPQPDSLLFGIHKIKNACIQIMIISAFFVCAWTRDWGHGRKRNKRNSRRCCSCEYGISFILLYWSYSKNGKSIA